MSSRLQLPLRLASFTLASLVLAVPTSAGPITITISGIVGQVVAPGTVNTDFRGALTVTAV
jgi:hypothetical protein